MRKSLLFGMLFFSLFVSVHAQQKENAKASEAVNRIGQEWQIAWNSHDMKALARLVAEDVDFVTVTGTWLRGRKAFELHHAERHGMQFKESVWETTSSVVKLIRPDVAVAHLEWSLKNDKNADGSLRQPRRGIFTWILEKRKGRWVLVASHNSNVITQTIAK